MRQDGADCTRARACEHTSPLAVARIVHVLPRVVAQQETIFDHKPPLDELAPIVVSEPAT